MPRMIAQFLLGSAPYTYTLPNSVVADQYPPQSVIDRIAPHAKELRTRFYLNFALPLKPYFFCVSYW